MTDEEFREKFPQTAWARKAKQLIEDRRDKLIQRLCVVEDDFKGVQSQIAECEYMLRLLNVNVVKPDTSR